MYQRSWIGVDFDGTLAFYGTWVSVDHVGQPIEAMVARVKEWLAEGKCVKVFTARVWPIGLWYEGSAQMMIGSEFDRDEMQVMTAKTAARAIDTFCLANLGQRLPITCFKDHGMVELWDDRCVQVIPNTGKAVGG